MTSGHLRALGTGIAICMLAIAIVFPSAQSQSHAQTGTSAVQGHVRDSSGKLVVDAAVLLQRTTDAATTAPETWTTQTDSEGAFRFPELRAGAYTLRAELKESGRATVSLVNLAPKESKTIDLVLQAASPSQSQSTSSSPTKLPEFFDEPQFTVAGVTQATNSGGHGSDTVLRNSEALVKATVSLGKESPVDDPAAKDSAETRNLQQERTNLQAQLLREDNTPKDKTRSGSAPDAQTRQKQSDLHHQLAQVEEKLGNPLEAVREYQRAAELTPSETNMFDWASELLTHRALEPATEVSAKGNRLYPQSVRMLIGLGVAWYARGSYDRAAQYLGSASDLAPRDPTPYLFMGRMQSVETVPSQETLERLARFQRLQPEHALANYYYAVSLWKWKQSASALDDASSAPVETLLQKAVELDPKLGAAHLQLGILYAQRGDYVRAIRAYLKAIEASPELEETHYRLAQAYRRTGKDADAQKELQLHEQLSKQAKEKTESERREIQQFVISLRDR